MRNKLLRSLPAALWITPLAAGLIFMAAARAQNSAGGTQMLKGEGPFNDWTNERPGNRYLIKASDLPKPYATDSAPNQSKVVPRPANAWPKVPEGFKIDQAAHRPRDPRTIVTAPNGDLFMAESAPGRIRVLRGFAADGKVVTNEVFATGLTMPYGIAFYPPGPKSAVRLYREHEFHRPLSLQEWRPEGQRPGANRCREYSRPAANTAAGTGRAAWCFRTMARSFMSVSGPRRMSAMTHRKQIAPMCSNSIRTDRASESMPTAFEIASGWRCIPRPASYGSL